MKIRSALVALALSLVALVPAGADGPSSTVINALSVSADGTLSATIDWGGQAPVVLGTDPAGDAPAGADDSLDVTELRAHVTDGGNPVVTFEWQLAALDQLPPPELVRYYWQFSIGGASFALQAKTSDVASAANLGATPERIAGNLTSYGEHIADTGTLPQFRLRGNCETIGVVNSCPHVAWAHGEFDLDDDVIRFFMPLDLDSTPQARFGATVTPTDGAWAAIQAAADNTNTRDSVTQLSAFSIPDHTAVLSFFDVDGNALGSQPLDVDHASAVDTSVAVPADAATAELQACFGANCATQTAAIG